MRTLASHQPQGSWSLALDKIWQEIKTETVRHRQKKEKEGNKVRKKCLHVLLTSTSSPSPMSFLPSAGGGILTSLKGTWRSGCQLKKKMEISYLAKTGWSLNFDKFYESSWNTRERETHLFSKAMERESSWMSLTKPCRTDRHRG